MHSRAGTDLKHNLMDDPQRANLQNGSPVAESHQFYSGWDIDGLSDGRIHVRNRGLEDGDDVFLIAFPVMSPPLA